MKSGADRSGHPGQRRMDNTISTAGLARRVEIKVVAVRLGAGTQ